MQESDRTIYVRFTKTTIFRKIFCTILQDHTRFCFKIMHGRTRIVYDQRVWLFTRDGMEYAERRRWSRDHMSVLASRMEFYTCFQFLARSFVDSISFLSIRITEIDWWSGSTQIRRDLPWLSTFFLWPASTLHNGRNPRCIRPCSYSTLTTCQNTSMFVSCSESGESQKLYRIQTMIHRRT